MFRFIKQMSIALLRFSRSLIKKCIPLSNQRYMTRLNLIGLNFN